MSVKIGLSSSKKVGFIGFNESPLKFLNNSLYFILKALVVLKIFNFCLDFFIHVGKQLNKKDKVNFKIYDIRSWKIHNK